MCLCVVVVDSFSIFILEGIDGVARQKITAVLILYLNYISLFRQIRQNIVGVSRKIKSLAAMPQSRSPMAILQPIKIEKVMLG